jgi:exodeoxyribonuclease V beta subunit
VRSVNGDAFGSFDLSGPLPTGTTVLEASAGTGKTFTIAGLVARWVAETPLRLPQLLVVTFTRAATAELRDRVRQRIVTTADQLADLGGRRAPATDDPVLAALAADPRRRAERVARLRRALTEIDVATISTIHGFCQHVLDGLGIASDLDREAELVDDLGELIEEVVDDVLVATYLEHGEEPRLSRDALLDLARVVVANPTTALVPDASTDPMSRLRLRLAARVRDEVAARARHRRQLSYDDLLTQLEGTLRDGQRGEAARQALRQRYRVTLIDEFQDTDPVQWSIVSRAFSDPDPSSQRALVLIGDPKQAIYAFRGADVHAYLDAARRSHVRYQLGTCWRSDADLLSAFETLFSGASFGDEAITYRAVSAAPGNDEPRIEHRQRTAALRLRLVPRHPALGLWKNKPNAARVRDLIARDVAADIVRLLTARACLLERDRDGRAVASTTLDPRHIAVLVRTNAESVLVQEALRTVGVPAVIGGVDSVFGTPAADDWQRLLEALERPTSTSRIRALALTSWIGWTGDEVAAADDRDWEELHEDVHRWARLLVERNVATMLRTAMLQRHTRPRLLGQIGGERRLADLEHIGEVLHAATTAEHLGPTSLAGWLRERIGGAAREQQDDRLRRLETDDEAVQVLTVHRSKGLEFPVVYCPYLWSSSANVRGAPIFHDDHGERHIDVGADDHPGFAESVRRAEEEARGEELRLLYVALTRAQHQVVAWYAPAGVPEWSGLGRLLLCRDREGRPLTGEPAPLLDDEEVLAAASSLADRSSGTIAVEEVPADPPSDTWVPEAPPSRSLERARFERGLDSAWRRTSYSALTSLDDSSPTVGSETDEAVKDDEPDGFAPVAGDAPAANGGSRPAVIRAAPLPLGDLPGGTGVGTLVHGVLERTDFAAADLPRELGAAVATELRRRRSDLDASVLVAGLHAAIETPLGPAAGGLRLSSIGQRARRDEVAFELPLDRSPQGRSGTVADLAELLRTYLPGDDPLAGYADRIPGPLLARGLRGYLGGSIDLLFQRPAPDGHPIFHVVDHKTNRLGRWGDPLTLWDYRPAALAEAMVHGHYPIQALLYTVAVHRLLRWRLPDYDPATHLGSVLYLFLRGMTGPDAPDHDGQPFGVFAWRPPTPLIEATSDLLHGRAPA